MEDKQIVELYLARSSEAIQKTEEKYGQYASYIAHHILQDEQETVCCTRESYELLWETIPPHRPQNLKAYLCKITRNHALQMKYPAANPEIDLFSAELVIYDFLKGLEAEQRKLFVARYWYLSLVSEIAMQYKMSESKVEKVVLSLRQKLEEQLAEKNIHLQSEEELLFAMTEIEDRYLAEAEPVQVKLENLVKTSADSNENEKLNIKDSMNAIWNRKSIPVIACIVLLIVMALVWPKNPIQENPYESGSEEGYFDSETGDGPDKITIDVGVENLVQILNGNTMLAEDFDKLAEKLPWSEGRDIAALPIYKNLSYTGAAGVPVYLDEDTLYAMAEEIAAKLDMEIIESEYMSVSDEAGIAVSGIVMTTDLGRIEVDGRGEVYVSFADGVTLPPGHDLSNEASKTNADYNVDYLIAYYWELFPTDDLISDSYATYDLEGNRKMNYRAVGTRNGSYDVEEYYFNQVYFYHDNQGKLTGFRFGDCRIAAESLGLYPLITLEEAKALLKEGKYYTNVWGDFVYDEANIRRVELLYGNGKVDEYYQPYYCFYMLLEDGVSYGMFYVTAAQGVQLYEAPPEPEIKILDLQDCEKMSGDFVYYSDGKYYTVENGEITEKESDEVLVYPITGQIEVEHTGTGNAVNMFYYGDSKVLNLDEVMAGKDYSVLGALYLDGKILIISNIYEGGAWSKLLTTCYVYSEEDGSLIQTLGPIESYYNEEGSMDLTFYGSQYGIMGNIGDNVMLVDALNGTVTDTGISCNDIYFISNAGDNYFAFVFNSRKIAIVEKSSGQIIKITTDKINGAINNVVYKDGLLYIETWYNRCLVLVISDFEEIIEAEDLLLELE